MNTRINATSLSRLGLASLAIAGFAPAALAQGDGPRAYFPVPKSLRMLTGYGIFLKGNQSADPSTVVKNGNIDVNLGVLQYTQPFVASGKFGAMFAVVPYGDVSGKVKLKLPNKTLSASSSGIGDIILGGIYTLVGPPPMDLMEYATYKPDYGVGLLLKLYTPTGEYSGKSPINVGANRYALQLGLPSGKYIGQSFLDPKLVTLELTPSVTFFTKNSNPYNAGSSQQDPLFHIEGHVTQNLNKAAWLSLDGLYTWGGQTKTDGKVTGTSQNSFGLGATAGLALSKATSIKITYGGIVSRSDGGADGHMWRITLNQLF